MNCELSYCHLSTLIDATTVASQSRAMMMALGLVGGKLIAGIGSVAHCRKG